MASVFKRKGVANWTIAWFDHKGDRQEKSSGTTDRRLAERLAAALSDRELERTRGLVDPIAERLAEQRAKPLSEHFDAFSAHLESLQRDAKHVDGTMRYLRKSAEELEWTTLASIDGHDLAEHLSEQAQARGTGARTFNAAVAAWRAFGRWCVRSNRLAANPLAGLETRNLDADRRRIRRDLTPDELARIIDAAEASPSVVVSKTMRDRKGELRTARTTMHAPDRAWAYRIAAGTGFRAGEVASLTRESFDLDGKNPSIAVEAAYSKRKRRDVQPIRPDLAAMLRPWLASKRAGEPVCPLPDGKAGLLLKADLATARAAWIGEAATPELRAEREASDYLRHTDSSGRVLDFHGLRVHFVSRVVEAGANVKEAMELARHSDPKLTLKTYARVGLHSLSRVLDAMPNPDARPERQAVPLRATGTDAHAGRDAIGPTHSGPHSPRGTGKVSAAGRVETPEADSGTDVPKPLQFQALRDSAQLGAGSSENAPRRTRTFDPLIKSQTAHAEIEGNSHALPHSGPHCSAEPAPATPTDPDLAAVVAAWATLPPAIRAGIVAMVGASGGGGRASGGGGR